MKKTTMTDIILVITATLTALIAGLFYSYSCSVNPGLANLGDAEYMGAMQSINRAILNPLFFLSFMGTLVFLPMSTFMNFTAWDSPKFLFLLGATLVYGIGTFGVTILGNVPLNEALDAFNLKNATATEITMARKNFELPWNNLHRIRTIASVISLILVVSGLVVKSKVSEIITS